MEIIAKTDNYITPDNKGRLLAKNFPNLYFYFQTIKIVLKAAKQAQKGLYSDEEWVKSSLKIVTSLEDTGAKFVITGKKHFINLDKPCVFVANHMSTLETFVLPCIVRPHRPITFVVKKNLVEMPIFKHIMISRDPITVTRENPREDFKAVIQGGMERLKKGVSIFIFPQTTRTTTFDPKKFNTIGVKLARKAQVPIIPVALKTDAWGIGKWIKDFGPISPQKTVYFTFGPPLEVKGNGKNTHQQIIAFISENLSKWS
ncbi:1-acyl-sn-glycerol-3-phosphate acyltransferase [Desulfohalobiaceae bacterium Ax17]|jgi:1-acyl-sn-glycerol-3-phosphate acyltransferase|uniref:lysophospholipid acyltransferase family protein n=1 Tax=Desulfovulcanus ferrireducens TaxID=2831190 RepID=UPI00207BB90E|nr:lysophospholipid acyltransferase family protein [Desulfovulcanus ferrireducens]MBT8763030.1 1-acyl-sn-glycerol-3-phosphate acyltransferase [Desulfovulcanus ferrireducens]